MRMKGKVLPNNLLYLCSQNGEAEPCFKELPNIKFFGQGSMGRSADLVEERQDFVSTFCYLLAHKKGQPNLASRAANAEFFFFV